MEIIREDPIPTSIKRGKLTVALTEPPQSLSQHSFQSKSVKHATTISIETSHQHSSSSDLRSNTGSAFKEVKP